MDGNPGTQRHDGRLSASPSNRGLDSHRSSSSATQTNNISPPQTRDIWSSEVQSSFDDHSSPFFGMQYPNFSSNPARFRTFSFPTYSSTQPRSPAERSGSDFVPGRNVESGHGPSSIISNRPWEAVARSSVDSLTTQNPPATAVPLFERRVFPPLFVSQAALPASQVPGSVEESSSPAQSTSTTIARPPMPQLSSISNELEHNMAQNDIRLGHTVPFNEEPERATTEHMPRLREVGDAASETRYLRVSMRDLEDMYNNDEDDEMVSGNRIDHFISRRNMQVNGTSTSRTQDQASSGTAAARIATRERLRRLPRGYGGPVKLVASTNYLESLEQPAIDSLDQNDRTCVICYNEYGVSNPEGVMEMPRRLPKCKHIFGNKCLKKWLKSADSCPYCRDKLPSTLKTIYRHTNRTPDETTVRRTPLQYTSVSGAMSDDDMDYGNTNTSDDLNGYLPHHLRARTLVMARRHVQTARNNDAPSVTEETSQPMSPGSYTALERAAPHEASRQSLMNYIHGYPQAHHDNSHFNPNGNTMPGGRTLPAPQPESMSSPYSTQFGYVDFYRSGAGSFNRQQIASSPGIPPIRRSISGAPSTQRMQSEFSYLTNTLPQSSDDFRRPWSPTQSASTQTRQMVASQEGDDTGAGSGSELNHRDYRGSRLSNPGSVTEGQQSNAARYMPTDQNTGPSYLRGGFQAGFVRSPVHHASPFRYSTTNNAWEVAR